jgi:excisionase family DNA binding protein
MHDVASSRPQTPRRTSSHSARAAQTRGLQEDGSTDGLATNIRRDDDVATHARPSGSPAAARPRPVTRLTPVDDLPELLRAEEAAAWLGCGVGTVYELIRRAELAHVRLGRLVRVPRAALAELAGHE